MLTTWEYSEKTEAERLIHGAHQIVVGFYKNNNFVVLPYNPNVKSANIVTFPDLNYILISRFWEQVKKVDIKNMPMVIDTKLIVSVVELMKNGNIVIPNFEIVKKIWQKAESEIVEEIYRVIPSKKDLIKKIIIYPTSFGTSCSFNFIGESGEVIIYLRDDQGIGTITEAIITSLTRNDIYEKLDGVWAESEIITDYLVTETSIATVLQKYEKTGSYLPTLKGTRNREKVELGQESNTFYKKLGISIDRREFNVNDFGNLTEAEKSLLSILIKNENEVVDFDTIGQAIFKNEDDFSLYAISKTVQRLRDKFESNGISGSYIQTLRGKGYLLKN